MALKAMERCTYRANAGASTANSAYKDLLIRSHRSMRPSNPPNGSCLLSVAFLNEVYPIFPTMLKACMPTFADDGRLASSKYGQVDTTMSDHDSCAMTEFDRLVLAHLQWLSFLPADKVEGQWAWGGLEFRHRPNKPMAWVLLLAVGLVPVMLGILLLMTHMPASEIIDPAPWAIVTEARGRDTASLVKFENESCLVLTAPNSDSKRFLSGDTSNAM
jgi:hypothetical protein